MRKKTGSHERNTNGLKESARLKREKTERRCEQAIQKLLRERRTINFSVVARAAKVSIAWLYKEPNVRRRIEHLRANCQPSKIPLPPSERISDASLRAQSNALKKRNQELTEEIKRLKDRVSVAYGIISSHNLPIPE